LSADVPIAGINVAMDAVPPLLPGRVKRPVSLWRHHIQCENYILKKY
jgi:hypothetical protein